MEGPDPRELNRRIDAMLDAMGACRSVGGFRYRICTPGEDDRRYADPGFDDGDWAYTPDGVPVGRRQGTTWYRFAVTLPASRLGIPAAGDSFRLAHFFFAPVDIWVDGVLRFSERAWMDFKSPECTLDADARPGRRYVIAVTIHAGETCYWNGGLGMGLVSDRLEELEFSLRSFRDELAHAASFPQVADVLPAVRAGLLDALADPGDASRIGAAIRTGRALLQPMAAGAKSRTVHLVGHAHIDMNWFWSMEETQDVILRDFRTMARFLDEFPEFRFSQSQCAAYDIAERLDPALFGRIRGHVADGRWEPTASAWVEGDLNLSDGESIVRHILLSKRYLSDRFGFEPRIMWCPDTFGHPANLPQILRKAGIDRYFFLRCGPGTDQAPEDDDRRLREARHVPLFHWVGQDGSRVTAANLIYGCDIWTAGLVAQSERMKQGFGLDNALFVFGTGDHGGGPTRRDILRIRELAASPTVPTLRFSTTGEYFDAVEAEGGLDRIPIHRGELNAVFDGCYTTHGDIKRYNRLCENALRAAEALSAAAGPGPGDAARLESAWRATLFNQFHDILDGSGVPATYAYSAAIAEAALADLAALSDERLAVLAAAAAAGLPPDPTPGRTGFLVFNPAPCVRTACVALPWRGPGTPDARDAAGRRLRLQPLADPATEPALAPAPATPPDPADPGCGTWLVEIPDLPSLGYATVFLAPAGNAAPERAPEAAHVPVRDEGGHFRFETACFRVEVDKGSGQVDTLFDKRTGRFVVRRGTIGWRDRNGTLNQLSVHDEEPTHMSAWTIGRVERIRNLLAGADASVVEDGPIRRILRFVHTVDGSRIEQDLVFEDAGTRIDIRTRVDWNEYGDFDRPAPMLRVSCSPDVACADALYDIPFGTLARPGQDREQPTLRFVDLSDRSGAFGFALLNDGKHGHRVMGNVLELALVRSGWLPDPRSDVGRHAFTYALMPHPGGPFDGRVPEEAACLNLPPLVVPLPTLPAPPAVPATKAMAAGQDRLPPSASFAGILEGTACLSALKTAESGDGWILRLYDPTGLGGESRVWVDDPFGRIRPVRAEETDLLERPVGGSLPVGESRFRVALHPYEIRTFLLRNPDDRCDIRRADPAGTGTLPGSVRKEA